ncbi:MAG: hypothetical protein ACREBE_28815 [bacterium]
MAPDDDDDSPSDTTIVRHGKEAFLLAEMGRFTRELQVRPLAKLVEDLPGLLALPESKYALVAMTLKKRMRSSDTEREAIASQLSLLVATSPPDVRARCEALLNIA